MGTFYCQKQDESKQKRPPWQEAVFIVVDKLGRLSPTGRRFGSKSALHYQECLEAKKLELSDEFKAKLGWLVGNMYSRVGTTDWESKMSSDSRRQMIEDDVNSRCVIGSKEQIKELKKQFEENADRISTHDEAIEYLSTVIVKSKYDKVMDIIEDTFLAGIKR